MKKKNYRIFLLFLFVVGFFACKSNDEGSTFNEPYDPNLPIIVSNIGPEKGGLGTRVVVSGSNFGNDPKKIKLFFNSKESLILKVQSNSIYAMVPKQPGEISTVKVVIEDGIDANGNPTYKEETLKDKQFKYNIKATVNTISGKVGESVDKDGSALEARFGRPVMLDVNDEGMLLIVDDNGGKIKMQSIQDQKVTSVHSVTAWQASFNLDFTKYYAVLRGSGSRPLLCVSLSKQSNWQEAESIYDQKNEKGEYIAGNYNYYGLAADDKYVYMMASSGTRLIRINQETRKVELIGENLDQDSWAHIAYNKKNGYLYITAENRGRLYRLNPYHTPVGRTTPWITQAEIEHIVGIGVGAAKEGNGKAAQLGTVEGCAADNEGNVYLADYKNHVIWKVDEEFNATIFAGVPGQSGYKDGKPKESLFNSPYDVTASPDGILYVADTYNYVIRCIAIQ